MSISDFLQLPPAVRMVFAVMLWPAVWAAVLLITAFADDFQRLRASRNPRAVLGARFERTRRGELK